MPHTIIGRKSSLGVHQLMQGEKGRELATVGKTKKNASVKCNALSDGLWKGREGGRGVGRKETVSTSKKKAKESKLKK